MKEDAPPPAHPPRKRYQLESQGKTPDLWLAVWASDPKLSSAERERVQAERDRRKALQPDRRVGVLVDREDVTPAQLEALRQRLAGATEIHHPWASRRLVGMCRRVGPPVVVHKEMRDVVVASSIVLAAPRAPEDFRNRTPAWNAIQLARHRKLAVTVVLPNGQLEGD